MNKTLFDYVGDETLNKFIKVGYNYIDTNYINVFRWLWNDCHVHPQIMCFEGDPENKTRVSLFNPINKHNEGYYCNSYDEALIFIVEYISRNISIYFENA